MVEFPTSVWISFGKTVNKAAPEQVRPASEEETLGMSDWLDQLRQAREDLRDQEQKDLVDITSEGVPPEEGFGPVENPMDYGRPVPPMRPPDIGSQWRRPFDFVPEDPSRPDPEPERPEPPQEVPGEAMEEEPPEAPEANPEPEEEFEWEEASLPSLRRLPSRPGPRREGLARAPESEEGRSRSRSPRGSPQSAEDGLDEMDPREAPVPDGSDWDGSQGEIHGDMDVHNLQDHTAHESWPGRRGRK